MYLYCHVCTVLYCTVLYCTVYYCNMTIARDRSTGVAGCRMSTAYGRQSYAMESRRFRRSDITQDPHPSRKPSGVLPLSISQRAPPSITLPPTTPPPARAGPTIAPTGRTARFSSRGGDDETPVTRSRRCSGEALMMPCTPPPSRCVCSTPSPCFVCSRRPVRRVSTPP